MTALPASNPAQTLVVDLDGTLLRSDLLYESFWAAAGKSWRRALFAVASLRHGPAALKRRLATAMCIDVSSLPYDPDVISRIEAWRRSGGRAALVTASDQLLADAVAEHLGIFDEVHGSDGALNLKGKRKAEFLEARFGRRAFVYVGDSTADLAVWARSAQAITVNAPRSLRAQAEQVCGTVEHLTTGAGRSVVAYLKALRPHQWLKNALVFAPMLAAHRFDAQTVVLSSLAFLCFSLVASGVYVLNDLLDLEADRAHPRKRLRPFASGRVPIAHGMAMATGLFGLGAGFAMVIGWDFFVVMAGYLLLTTAYSFHLKRRIIIDICILAGLYTSRIIAGGVATGIDLSVWLLAFSVFFFLSLAAVKRQAELVDTAARGQLDAHGRGYRVDDLPIIGMVSLGAGYVSVLVMVLYLNSPDVLELYAWPVPLWGVCCVLLYWITRMVMVTHRGAMHDDPLVYAARDRVSQLCLAMMVAFALGGVLA